MVTPLTFNNPVKFGLDSCHNIKVRHTFLHWEREHSKPHANHATHTCTSIIREGPPTGLTQVRASPWWVVEWRPNDNGFLLRSRSGIDMECMRIVFVKENLMKWMWIVIVKDNFNPSFKIWTLWKKKSHVISLVLNS